MLDISDKTAMKILRGLAKTKEDYLERAEKAVVSVGIIAREEARDFADSGFQQGSKKVNTLCLCVKHLFLAYMMGRNESRARKFSNYVYREMFESSDRQDG